MPVLASSPNNHVQGIITFTSHIDCTLIVEHGNAGIMSELLNVQLLPEWEHIVVTVTTSTAIVTSESAVTVDFLSHAIDEAREGADYLIGRIAAVEALYYPGVVFSDI